jgi:hypothetical protein
VRSRAPRPAPPRDPWIGLLEPALAARTLSTRRMFGCIAYYDDARLVWVSAARRDPWRGILVPTERECHAALRARVPALRPHPVLGKWLYLSARLAAFESAALAVAALVADGDPLVGVMPVARRPRVVARRSGNRKGGFR